MQPYKQEYKPWRNLQTSQRSIGSMQPCLLKNSPRSTVLLLLKVGVKPKKVIGIDWLDFFTIVGVQYLYPEPKHESYSSMTYYNLWYKTFLTWDNLDPNLFFFVESDIFFPTPIVAHWRYLLMSSKESRSQYRVWISWYRSLYNRFLDDTILKTLSFCVLFVNFDVNNTTLWYEYMLVGKS